MILSIVAKDSCSSSVLAVACSNSCCTLENRLNVIKTCFLASTGKKCVLYYCVLNIVLTKLFSELCIVLCVNTFVADNHTCD